MYSASQPVVGNASVGLTLTLIEAKPVTGSVSGEPSTALAGKLAPSGHVEIFVACASAGRSNSSSVARAGDFSTISSWVRDCALAKSLGIVSHTGKGSEIVSLTVSSELVVLAVSVDSVVASVVVGSVVVDSVVVEVVSVESDGVIDCELDSDCELETVETEVVSVVGVGKPASSPSSQAAKNRNAVVDKIRRVDPRI